MDDHDVLIGCVLEDAWLTLEQIAAACSAVSSRPIPA